MLVLKGVGRKVFAILAMSVLVGVELGVRVSRVRRKKCTAFGLIHVGRVSSGRDDMLKGTVNGDVRQAQEERNCTPYASLV